jgi:septum formation inhibitor MinC
MNRKILVIAVVGIAAIVLAACKTPPVAAGPNPFESAPSGNNVTTAANKMVIRDWSYRGIGEIENPAWLYSAIRGNFNPFKSAFEVDPTRICRPGIGTNANRNAALIQANALFAAQLAQELRATVLVRTGAASNNEVSDGEYAAVLNAVIEANVTVSGFQRITDFWQQLEVTDANGRKRDRYDAYIIYACPPDVWDKIVATYLMDIVGRLPEKKTQQAIAGMFEELKADTRREQEKTDAQWLAEVEAKKQAVENQQQLAMAQTPGGVMGAKAAGEVAQTQAVEKARTLRTAIRSGDPVAAAAAIAAATIAPGDVDAVAALAAAAGL